ncbi:Ras GTPase-activating protein gap-2 [Trichinella britovi]|uniref:Ras GTPase-activating protein gap-2 n=1 Tax=Trichinella britovi TaxID=45882 RepID=A0A0V1DB70_TRIBR|nr:Ras GTPase-activating protein gap-2 [Trichinella britovi]
MQVQLFSKQPGKGMVQGDRVGFVCLASAERGSGTSVCRNFGSNSSRVELNFSAEQCGKVGGVDVIHVSSPCRHLSPTVICRSAVYAVVECKSRTLACYASEQDARQARKTTSCMPHCNGGKVVPTKANPTTNAGGILLLRHFQPSSSRHFLKSSSSSSSSGNLAFTSTPGSTFATASTSLTPVCYEEKVFNRFKFHSPTNSGRFRSDFNVVQGRSSPLCIWSGPACDSFHLHPAVVSMFSVSLFSFCFCRHCLSRATTTAEAEIESQSNGNEKATSRSQSLTILPYHFKEWSNNNGDLSSKHPIEVDSWSLDRRPALHNNNNNSRTAAIGSGKLTMPQPLPVMCTPESRRIPSHPTATYSASAQLFTSSTPTSSSSKLANFFARPFRNSALKRTKSVSKLDRKRSNFEVPVKNGALSSTSAWNDLNKVRNSRSHDSLLISSGGSSSAAACLLPQTGGSNTNTNTNCCNTVVDLSNAGCSASSVHSSLLATPNCFRITTVNSAGVATPKYFSCGTAAERDRWLYSLNHAMQPNRDQMRRKEKSLQVWILEAKGVTAKRRYFCELALDSQLYSRTSSKLNQDICFWGEQFVVNNLIKLDEVKICLYRESERKKRKDRNTLVGSVRIPVRELCSKYAVEKWYVLNGQEKSASKGETISLRVKARFQSISILPLKAYSRLLQFLTDKYLETCLALEPVLGVKAKEDFATSLIRIMHSQNLAKHFLCDLIMSEIKTLENDHLMFRGNSLATKAMEAYIKMIGEQYIQRTLASFVQNVQDSGEDCEVDPEKLPASADIVKHQEALLTTVHAAWGRILNSFYEFPIELRLVFHELRNRLADCGRGELADNLISSSIFLRFLCPAILSPSLFNLVQEYPYGKTARNLTLVAKTVQTLANFTKFGAKEHYMEFMNRFVEGEWQHMRQFLRRISSPLCTNFPCKTTEWSGVIDLGKELSLLHSYLIEVLPEAVAKKSNWENLNRLCKIVDDVSCAYNMSDISCCSSASPGSAGSSDYENKGESPCVALSFDSSGDERSKALTDDDLWYNAVDENIGLRRMGLMVQQSRLKQQLSLSKANGFELGRSISTQSTGNNTALPTTITTTTAATTTTADGNISAGQQQKQQLVAGGGDFSFGGCATAAAACSDDICYVDETTSLLFKSSSNAQNPITVEPSTVGTSDYNSLSNSPVGSADSSSGCSEKRLPAADQTSSSATMSNDISLAVANPLYSLQHVPVVWSSSAKTNKLDNSASTSSAAASAATASSTTIVTTTSATATTITAAAPASSASDVDRLLRRAPPLRPIDSVDTFHTATNSSTSSSSSSSSSSTTNPHFAGGHHHSRAMSLSIAAVNAVPPISCPITSASGEQLNQRSGGCQQTAELLLAREVQELRIRLDESQSRLQQAELRERTWKQKYEESVPIKWSSDPVQPILHRLRLVEEELQQEMNSSAQKQQLIDEQRDRIQALLATNERLALNLSKLQEKSASAEQMLLLTSLHKRPLDKSVSVNGHEEKKPTSTCGKFAPQRANQQQHRRSWDPCASSSICFNSCSSNSSSSSSSSSSPAATTADTNNVCCQATDVVNTVITAAAEFAQLKTTQC